MPPFCVLSVLEAWIHGVAVALYASQVQHVSHALQNNGPEGSEAYHDPNIIANHLHGFNGNPGTDNVPCDPPPADGVPCYRGDNIFIDVFPGQCSEWQYDVPNNHSLGMLW